MAEFMKVEIRMTASGSGKKEMGSQYSVGVQSFSFGR